MKWSQPGDDGVGDLAAGCDWGLGPLDFTLGSRLSTIAQVAVDGM